MSYYFINWIVFCVADEAIYFLAEESILPQVSFGVGIVALEDRRVVHRTFQAICHNAQGRDGKLLIHIVGIKHGGKWNNNGVAVFCK